MRSSGIRTTVLTARWTAASKYKNKTQNFLHIVQNGFVCVCDHVWCLTKKKQMTNTNELAVMNEAASLIQIWWTKGLPLMKFDEYNKCPCRFDTLCAPHQKEDDARKNCHCHHQPLCSRCEIYYYGDEFMNENRWDGCRYDCVKCKRKYKNKYFGRNTSLCHDCEWAEHESRKLEQ